MKILLPSGKFRFLISVAVGALAVSFALFGQLQRTTWWAGYDLHNCPGCKPSIDWSAELGDASIVGEAQRSEFEKSGVIILPQAVGVDKVHALAREVDALPPTIMTHILARLTLKQYIEYEHRIDTRSEILRDWAIHGPLGKWAAQLMNATEVRLYNAEKIYHRGDPNNCKSAWHRDTIAAPFPPETPSLTINVYLDDINADKDVLIYVPGSHHDLESPPPSFENTDDGTVLLEPSLRVGDILAHDPRVFHAPSGRNCWRRRSLQFRYVASPTTFDFDNNRFPHGPIPWTLAHTAGVAPHGLISGDSLAGPAYPRVYPSPLPETEHVAFPGQPWTILALLGAANEAVSIGKLLDIENRENCTIVGQGDDQKYAYFGFDGPVTNCKDWKMLGGIVPVHEKGQIIRQLESNLS